MFYAKPWKKLSQADIYQLSPSDSGVIINGGSENSPIKQRANPTYSSHNGISSSSAGTGQYNPQNGLTGNISLKTTANGPGTSGITDQSQSLFSHQFMRVPKRSLSDPVWQYDPVRDSQNNQVVSQTFQEYDMWNWNGFNLAKMIEEGLCKEDNNEPAKTSSTPTNPGINCKVGLPGCDCKLSKN
ncbi:uncharacterized protein LOC129003808 [Macrosteles quadrilineatus]|uniref:uncharacterized protein LOC129003808 n=1 Tax=Macrosteles quadrilineatus TaxID=74068 RepID=UPI0023E0F9E2|nr:uncharacterized protein LOC129003808 [Macrosteles quadrilineatus]